MKPKTFFVDIDGCIFEHMGCGASQQWHERPIVLNKTKQTLDEIEACGDMIVLVTARPEHYRDWAIQCLADAGIIWHKLIMGVTSGQRVIVNDRKPGSDEPSCVALDIERNKGLTLS